MINNDNKDSGNPAILHEGRSYYKKSRANRASLLIDAENYFAAFVRALEQAKHTIYIAGWDIDSRISLLRGDDFQTESSRLGPFLDRLARSKKDLHIFILDWDFSMVFMLEREPFPVFKLDWRTHKRIRFVMDGEHPVGGSHHQKIVVVDDSMAFCGGLDLAKFRWDTSEHRIDDSRRHDSGQDYLPFHDVQMVFDGKAAHVLGDLFRRRWLNATGENLPLPPRRTDLHWPVESEPDLSNVDISVARTEPAYKNNPEVVEILNLYTDAIGAAQKFIYIENQYFTSAALADVLSKRLIEPNGPEVVLVLPHKSAGWLEESIMDTRRALTIRRLIESDRYNRFRVYYPVVPGMEDGDMIVHSKVLIVDDRLFKVGSSNCSNRSLGVDTECDVAIESEGNSVVAAKIEEFRNRLLGEHLGVSPSRIATRMQMTNSMIQTIEDFRGTERSLKPLLVESTPVLETLSPGFGIIDPEKPMDSEQLLEMFLPEDTRKESGGGRIKFGLLVFGALVLAILWKYGPLGEWITMDKLAAWGSLIRDHPMAPILAVGSYILGGLVMMPLTILVAATGLIFPPMISLIVGFTGALASAAVNYFIGMKIGRETLRKLAGGKLNKISKKLAKQGLVAVISIRMLPVAPFQVVNLVMGASHIRFKDFLLGTLIGLAPGIVGISFFADSVYHSFKNPSVKSVLITVAIVATLISLSFLIQRFLGNGDKTAGKVARRVEAAQH